MLNALGVGVYSIKGGTCACMYLCSNEFNKNSKLSQTLASSKIKIENKKTPPLVYTVPCLQTLNRPIDNKTYLESGLVGHWKKIGITSILTEYS